MTTPFTTTPKIAPRTRVMLIRSELPTLLAAECPTFIFHNTGRVIKVMGSRACVAWEGHQSLWFDFDALKKIRNNCSTKLPSHHEKTENLA